MKAIRMFLFAILFSIACTGIAQVSGHLKFKGIPMEGSLQSFVDKLKAKGVTYLSTKDGVASLKGEFAATNNCQIFVSKMPDADKVNKVIVLFPEQETWRSLSNQYEYMKELLTEKYGEPDVIEKFHENVNEEQSKFFAILHNEADYISEFNTSNGIIQLSMTKSSTLRCSVLIRYIDDSNEQELRQRIMDDL